MDKTAFGRGNSLAITLFMPRIEETVMVKRSAGDSGSRFGEYVGNKLITYSIHGLDSVQ